MAIGLLLDTNPAGLEPPGARLGGSRRVLQRRCTPAGMDTNQLLGTGPTMTLTELADYLSVSNQALYDLRSRGRGPRGFRVGRELRFRLSEIEAWLARLEAADAERHPPRDRQ